MKNLEIYKNKQAFIRFKNIYTEYLFSLKDLLNAPDWNEKKNNLQNIHIQETEINEYISRITSFLQKIGVKETILQRYLPSDKETDEIIKRLFFVLSDLFDFWINNAEYYDEVSDYLIKNRMFGSDVEDWYMCFHRYILQHTIPEHTYKDFKIHLHKFFVAIGMLNNLNDVYKLYPELKKTGLTNHNIQNNIYHWSEKEIHEYCMLSQSGKQIKYEIFPYGKITLQPILRHLLNTVENFILFLNTQSKKDALKMNFILEKDILNNQSLKSFYEHAKPHLNAVIEQADKENKFWV